MPHIQVLIGGGDVPWIALIAIYICVVKAWEIVLSAIAMKARTKRVRRVALELLRLLKKSRLPWVDK